MPQQVKWIPLSYSIHSDEMFYCVRTPLFYVDVIPEKGLWTFYLTDAGGRSFYDTSELFSDLEEAKAAGLTLAREKLMECLELLGDEE